ncbi:helix-hairpin-helix domain-containing protein [Silanimonas sp.]|jgi:competence protein ComEA|uniref:ComEA family DNA-binding protein n=1 Tax=Silanimonas sp. TaxID=1929290 RepID=UPI0022BF9370|nr:helix-hairpin-helix domain-containing protein [Silanimonas sp.]MCZ8062751.1 helix-hairpin-helix domain-containing protein [Silanimonas sp.]
MNFLSKTFAALLLALAFAGTAQANERININTADAATLDRVMDGVGPAKAAAIVEHRRVHGPFRSIDQLVNVKGIGPATLELNRARIMVGGAPAAAPGTARAATSAPRPTAPAPRVR